MLGFKLFGSSAQLLGNDAAMLRPSKPLNYVYAAGISAVALWLSRITHAPASVLLTAMFIATILCGAWPGLLALGLSAAGFAFFFGTCQCAAETEPSGPMRFVIFIFASFAAWGVVRHKQSIDAALLKLSKRLGLIIENSPVGILSIDLAGNIFRANLSVASTFGYQPEELIGKPVEHILPGFDLTLKARSDASGFHQSGAPLFTQVTLVELAGESDANRILFIRDVTDGQRAMKTLQRKEADLRLFRESVSRFNWNAGPTGEVIYDDADILGNAGKLTGSVADTGWIRLIHPDDRAHAAAEWANSVVGVKRHDVAWRCLQADGSFRWLRFISEPVLDHAGLVLRWDGVAVDVHDVKQAEEQLRESEQALRLTLEGVPGMVCVCSSDAHLEYANDYVLAYIGCEFPEVAGLGWLKAIHPDDLARMVLQDKYVADASGAFAGEYRIRRSDGEYRWFDVRMAPLHNAGRPASRWCALLVDIDDRKRAEQALEASQRSLQRIVDTVPGMIYVASPSGELTYINQHLLDYIGKSVTGISWGKSIHPDDHTRAMTAWKTCIAHGAPMELVHRMRRADGEYRWFRGRVIPLLTCDGEVRNWYGLLHDIHDQRLAEDALRESERRFRLFIDTLPALVWCATPDGRPAYFSQRYVDYTGAPVRDPRWQGFDDYAGLALHGALMKWSDNIFPDDVIPTLSMWEHALETGESYEAKCRIRRFDGVYRWFHVRAEPLRDSYGDIVNWYGFDIDIDEAMKIEEALFTTQCKLARAAQITSVAELSASIAHEISQPLAAIVANGYACQRWLSASSPNIAQAMITVERILRDGNKAAEVLNRIRALFKKTALTKSQLDMNEVIMEVRQLVIVEAHGKGASVDVQLAEHLPCVYADRIQMQQVLINLIHNGLEAMDDIFDRPKNLLVHSLADDDFLTVEISDAGCGVEDLEGIFEAFVTTKEKGMGMGLAICRSIIDAHGGRLWATLNPVHGTTFSFSLTLHPSTDHECD
jgi:PAS domain S-box-containing protein